MTRWPRILLLLLLSVSGLRGGDRPSRSEPRPLGDCLLPALKNGGFRMDDFILWCPSVIQVGKTYHLFASRWPAPYGLGGWTKYSECVRATSTNLLGPYTFQEVVLQKRPDQWDNTRIHNVKIVQAGAKFVLYYIDTANETGFAEADAVTGPWTRHDQPVMRVSNPAVLVRPDRSIYVFGRLRDKSEVNRAIAFTAPSYQGPYSVLANGDNLLPNHYELEDPTIWWANNQFNVLLNDWKGKATGITKAGAQYSSLDGIHYTLVSRQPVFTKIVLFDDGSSETFSRRERPFVYVNEKQEAIALFTACLPSQGPARIVAQPVDRYYPGSPRVFLLDGTKLAAARQRLPHNQDFAPALEHLLSDANELLSAKPVSVMDKTVVPPSGDKHDYMSQAPYFWPDPKTSNGLPYLRHDGKRNPEISRIPDHGDILGMPEKAQTLALAWYFTGHERYAAKAAELLRVWFLDPATRMNPNFEFAQGIPGVNTGRGIGLIESRGLAKAVDAVGLLAGSAAWTEADQNGIQRWYSQFLQWMLESPYGRDEAAGKNNHGTYYDLQVASFALFVGKRDLAIHVLQTAKEKRIATQIEPDGRQPLELARTKAWSYSLGNLSGLMSLAELGDRVGVDLWNFQTADGRSIRKAFEYLLPYGVGEKPWPYQQLGGGAGRGFSGILRKAAAHFDDPSYDKLAERFAKIDPSGRERLLQ